ncbi:MAG: hypothetical protein GEU83_20685 [Pseudonocardiaceae bacterium]|nr:hypothetical protein [Pseudonocardiaceae bacterium]
MNQTTHPGPEHGPAEVRAGRLTVAELLQRETTVDEPVAAGRGFYRLLAVAAGIVLIMASGAALASPRVERELPATGVLEHITGPGALRPDLSSTPVDERSGGAPGAAATGAAPPGAAGAPSSSDGRSLPADGAAGPGNRAAESGPVAEPGDDAATGTGDPAGPSAEPRPDQLADTITSFYQQVVTNPADAYTLLGRGMRGSGYAAFADSWSDVERVTVDSIHSDGPDAAVVAVVVEHVDGSVLRSVQRVMVTGDPARIESARLLSAAAA